MNVNSPPLAIRRASRLILTLGILLALSSTSGCYSFVGRPAHAGVTLVAAPAPTEQDAGKWYAYYADQLDAYVGSVVAPSSASPEPQRQGYQRASSEYTSKLTRSTMINAVIWGVIVAGASLLLSLALVSGSGY